MKNNRLLLLLGAFVALLTAFTSCEKRVDSRVQWRNENEKAFASYADSTGFSKAGTDGSNAFVYMKKLKEGMGKEFPIETSRVLVHYEAYLLAGSKGFVDGNFDSESPIRLVISRGTPKDSPQGLRIALQNMVVGEESLIVVPWHLAYGSSDFGNIRGYTALRYRVQLDSIIPESKP